MVEPPGFGFMVSYKAKGDIIFIQRDQGADRRSLRRAIAECLVPSRKGVEGGKVCRSIRNAVVPERCALGPGDA